MISTINPRLKNGLLDPWEAATSAAVAPVPLYSPLVAAMIDCTPAVSPPSKSPALESWGDLLADDPFAKRVGQDAFQPIADLQIYFVILEQKRTAPLRYFCLSGPPSNPAPRARCNPQSKNPTPSSGKWPPGSVRRFDARNFPACCSTAKPCRLKRCARSH